MDEHDPKEPGPENRPGAQEDAPEDATQGDDARAHESSTEDRPPAPPKDPEAPPFEYTLQVFEAAPEPPESPEPAQVAPSATEEPIVGAAIPPEDLDILDEPQEEIDLTPAQTDAEAPPEAVQADAAETEDEADLTPAQTDADAPAEEIVAQAPPPALPAPLETVEAAAAAAEADPADEPEATPDAETASTSEPEPAEAAEAAAAEEEEGEPEALAARDAADEAAPEAEVDPTLFGAEASPETVFEGEASEAAEEAEPEVLAAAEPEVEPEAEPEAEPEIEATASAEPEAEPVETATEAVAPDAPEPEDEPELQAAAMEAAEDQPEEAETEIVTRSLFPKGFDVGGRAIEHTPPPFPEPAQTDPTPPAGTVVAATIGATLTRLATRVGLKAKDPGAPAKPKIEWKRPKTFDARRIAIMAMGMIFLMVAGVCVFFIYVTSDIPSTKSLWTADNSPSLTFVDRRGRAIIREGAEAAPPVDLNRLPAYVPNAVIAIEDRRFFEHFGVDVSGLVRAAALNFRAGHVVQGGSTITQQLAKNLFLSNNRTFRRKLQEVALALWLESQFSKREILALYMSRVYFGAGAYGVEAAAERYFDKPAKDLTLAEAALLAGLVKAPSKLNPAAQDAGAKARAKIVLDEMLAANFITPQQHEAALRAPLAISRRNPNGNLGYFRDWIDPQLVALIGDQRDDFIVETTLDLEAQRAGELALQTVIDREKKTRHVSQGALLAMDATGGVTTMVGGLNYGKEEGQSEFNRTTQSLRAPGSSFKYFIYMTAMDKGLTPWTVRVDKPIVIGDWAPGNYEDKYFGPVTLSTAYAKSLNMVAIALANEVGGQAVIDTAHKLGVGKRLENYRSLGLGAQGMTVMEMVTGYGAMAAGGYPIEPHGIERIRRSNGQILWARRPAPQEQVIDPRTVRMMNFLGGNVVRAGTGTGARIEGREIAGKTGTSNDYRDAWFIGYVPGYVAGVWLGNDDNTPMNRVTGGLLSAEVWKGFMTVALRDTPIQALEMPSEDEYPPVVLPTPMEAIPEAPAISEVTAPTPAVIAPPPGRNTRTRGGDG